MEAGLFSDVLNLFLRALFALQCRRAPPYMLEGGKPP
jgi:hypothetical protein